MNISTTVHGARSISVAESQPLGSGGQSFFTTQVEITDSTGSVIGLTLLSDNPIPVSCPVLPPANEQAAPAALAVVS